MKLLSGEQGWRSVRQQSPSQVISPDTKIPSSSQKWANRNTKVKGKLRQNLLILEISQGEPEQASSESLSDLHVVEIGLKPVKCVTLGTSPSCQNYPAEWPPPSWEKLEKQSVWRCWSELEEQGYLCLWIFWNNFIPRQFTVNNWVERVAENERLACLLCYLRLQYLLQRGPNILLNLLDTTKPSRKTSDFWLLPYFCSVVAAEAFAEIPLVQYSLSENIWLWFLSLAWRGRSVTISPYQNHKKLSRPCTVKD